MLDPEGRPADPPVPKDSGAPPTEPLTGDPPAGASPTGQAPTTPLPDDWPAVRYWAETGVVPTTATAPPPPSPPAWTRTYDLPTARTVVSAGLQLAVAASRQIRRASIYIGLLSLGAFGPAIILMLVGVGRLMNSPGTAETLANNPALIFFEQPEILAAFGLVYVLFGLGLILLIAIGIDAQAIAIALLAGVASGQPLRLWEAIIRARQIFWRLAGAGIVVGIASSVVSLIVTIPFIRPVDSNQGISFIGQMIGILAVAPFTFVATGIVLGDVGVVESLQRSVALFRARKRVALVVTLFTLVASAIQTFAIFAGLDLAVRVAEFLHLGLDQGGPAPVLLGAIILAFIVAFGSLSFTVAAIVAAPQVAGFLGLTFFSGGLDRARVEGDAKPRGFRWVTLPMLAVIVILAVVAGFGLPSMASFDPGAVAPLLGDIRAAAKTEGNFVTTYGSATTVVDPELDQAGDNVAAIDIVAADYAYLQEVPDWVVDDMFDCRALNVACSSASPGGGGWAEGAYLFLQRMAGPPGVVGAGDQGEWGPVLALDGYDPAPAGLSTRFPGASHAFITTVAGESRRVQVFVYRPGGFQGFPTAARSTWIGDDLITLVPVISDLAADPISWDTHASWSAGGAGTSSDSLRSAAGVMKFFETAPDFWLDPIPSFGP